MKTESVGPRPLHLRRSGCEVRRQPERATRHLLRPAGGPTPLLISLPWWPIIYDGFLALPPRQLKPTINRGLPRPRVRPPIFTTKPKLIPSPALTNGRVRLARRREHGTSGNPYFKQTNPIQMDAPQGGQEKNAPAIRTQFDVSPLCRFNFRSGRGTPGRPFVQFEPNKRPSGRAA